MLVDYIRAKKDILLIKPFPCGTMSLEDTLEEIRNFVNNTYYSKMVLDLTKVDFFSALKLGVLISTQYFIQQMEKGKIYIVVRDKLVKKSIETLNINAKIIETNKTLALDDIA